MRLFFGLIVFVPLAVVLGVFAVENRTPVALEIWPLPGVYQAWASVWVLGLFAVGLVFGLAIAWLSGTGWRRRARRAENRARVLERKLTEQDEPSPFTAPGGSRGTAALAPPGSRAGSDRQPALIGD